MRYVLAFCGLFLAAGIGGSAYGAQVWSISARQPCTGLTVGFAKPLAELNKSVGPHWQAAPGPVKGSGLVLVFIATCPNSSYNGKTTGAFGSAFVLVPVEQSTTAGAQTHAIAVLQAAGKSGTPVMKLFRSHGIPVTNAQVSLTVHNLADGKQVVSAIRTIRGVLGFDALMESATQPMKSTDTTAVLVSPPAMLFSGPESSTRYAKGKAELHADARAWLAQYHLGAPLFVTLDTDFIWKFAFQRAPRS